MIAPVAGAATQLDVMAYADRLLDPARRREVEQLLAHRPDLLEVAQAIGLQNDAVRQAYDPILDEALPTGLTSVVQHLDPPRNARRLRHAAAVAALVTMTGAAGWWVGTSMDSPPDEEISSFVTAASSDTAPSSVVATSGVMWPTSSGPLEWLADRVTLELRAPDLTERGYRLAGQSLVEIDGQPSVRLNYERRDGGAVNLFLRTRWRDAPPAANLDVKTEGKAAYWFDGPMMWVLTGDIESDNLKGLAETIHGTTRLKPRPAEQPPAQNALGLEGSLHSPVAVPQ